MRIIGLSGSPSASSRSASLLRLAQGRLRQAGHDVDAISLRDLPAAALLSADARDPALRAALDAVARADAVIVSTPIYKAAYSGLLKTFLDLLPQDGLRGRTVLPLATGGSLAHLLALDYALRPVLSALGARDVLDPVFATDTQLVPRPDGGHQPDEALRARLERVMAPLMDQASRALRCSA